MNDVKATDKQIKYLKSLVKEYYQTESKRESILARLTASDCKLSKRNASKAIGILKPICEVYRECYHRIWHNIGGWESYFRANIDIYDDSNDKALDAIFATA